MKRKKTIIVSSAVLAVGLISVVMASLFSGPQIARDPKQQTVDEKRSYLASKEFGSLPDSEKLKYIKAAKPREVFKNNRNISSEEKKQLRKNIGPVFKAMMKQMIDKYSELPTREAKNAYLDEMIDKKMQYRKARTESRNGSSAEDEKRRENRRAERRRKGPPLDRIKNKIETTDPVDQAKWTEFMVDMRNRMKERGIKPRWRR